MGPNTSKLAEGEGGEGPNEDEETTTLPVPSLFHWPTVIVVLSGHSRSGLTIVGHGISSRFGRIITATPPPQ
jgi:hypothetical protein